MFGVSETESKPSTKLHKSNTNALRDSSCHFAM